MMIFNRLTIKCENPIKLAQIRELLVEEDEYQREIFTMKKLLPVAEKKSNYKRLREYDFTWNINNHGIVQNVISEFIHDKSGEISFYYHSNYWIHFSWITVLGGFLNSIRPSSEEDEKTRFSLELMTYDLNEDRGKHYYWDGMEQDKTSPISYGLLDFAVNHHPGLMNYLKIQAKEYNQEKLDVQISIEGQKNNCMSNPKNHGNC